MKRKNSTTITVQCDYDEDGSSTTMIPAAKKKRNENSIYDGAIRSIAKTLIMHKETHAQMASEIRKLHVRVNNLEKDKKKKKYSVIKRMKQALTNS
jgi:hypothetical protein